MTISHTRIKIITAIVVVSIPIMLIAQTSTSPTATTDTTSGTTASLQPTTTETTTTNTTDTTSTQPSPTTQTSPTTSERVRLCVAQVDEIMARATENTTLTQCTTALTRAGQSVRARQTEETQLIAQSRAEWDKLRAAQFAQLRALAKTDRQKRAVEAFIQAMNTTVLARKQGVNTAVETFYTGRQRAVDARQEQARSAMAHHEQTLTALSQKAKADCALAVETNTIRATLLESREAVQRSLQSVSACQGIDTMFEENTQGIVARTQAIERTLSEFSRRADSARIELRTAFGLQ